MGSTNNALSKRLRTKLWVDRTVRKWKSGDHHIHIHHIHLHGKKGKKSESVGGSKSEEEGEGEGGGVGEGGVGKREIEDQEKTVVKTETEDHHRRHHHRHHLHHRHRSQESNSNSSSHCGAGGGGSSSGSCKTRSEISRLKMENLLGLLRVRVIRGVELAVRDVCSSDPYVTLKMGDQRLKTRVINKNVNPEWNEDLTLSVTDTDPENLVKLTVFDHDTFTKDDKMGEADFEIKTFIDAVRIHHAEEDLPSGTVLAKVAPCRQNCLSEESHIIWEDGKVIQNLCLRLKSVESGEVEVQLQWIDLPGCKGLHHQPPQQQQQEEEEQQKQQEEEEEN